MVETRGSQRRDSRSSASAESDSEGLDSDLEESGSEEEEPVFRPSKVTQVSTYISDPHSFSLDSPARSVDAEAQEIRTFSGTHTRATETELQGQAPELTCRGEAFLACGITTLGLAVTSVSSKVAAEGS